MQIERYFHTPILKSYDLKNSCTFLESVIDKYLEEAGLMYDIDGHISTYGNKLLTDKINGDESIKFFRNSVISMGRDFLYNRGYDISRIEFQPSFFVSSITKGGYFHRHAHPNSILSGVFYVNAMPETSNIIFHDPRPYKMFRELPVRKPTYDNASEMTFDVNTGMLLMWDAWLEHEVSQNKSVFPRKTIVFNL